jgi:3',5'-cyclic-AMP phosphodiesterase
MQVSRKKFITLGIQSVLVFGQGDLLASITNGCVKLPRLSQISLRFALASDGHYGQPDTQYQMHHENMVAWLNQESLGRGLDFAMINGDLFHNDPAFMPQVKNVWDGLKMPYYVSHGNHDLINETRWQETWNIPWHYSFEKKGTAFLILNTANEKGEYVTPDPSWVKDQLARYEKNRHLIVFMHITPFKWTNGGSEYPEVVEMFNKQYNLKLIFHGHDHDQDNVKEKNGKYYFFDSHIAGNWGTEYRGYRIVEMLKGGKILTYQMNAAIQTRMNENQI